ncbi:ribonuclease H-like domain-containing protein [Mycena vulgaris]|nr:ribonuclease H-like domain-containing protein [Mycena vulgaris]
MHPIFKSKFTKTFGSESRFARAISRIQATITRRTVTSDSVSSVSILAASHDHAEPPVAVAGASEIDSPPTVVLPLFPQDYDVHYLTTEAEVNTALAPIIDGAIGFDTESVNREATSEETIINDTIDLVGGSRKSAMLCWHVLESRLNPLFPYAWETMGLCLVQISNGRDVWLIHLRLMKAFPDELRRVLLSPAIAKVGVGLVSDITTAWNDLRVDLVHLVDVGMMARLALAPQFPTGAYQNLSLETSVEEILGYRVEKDEQKSDWSKKLNSRQIRYAATDAVAALRLYEAMVPRIRTEARRLQREIPTAWYTFNSRMGEPTRIKPTIRGDVVPWSIKDCTWFFGGKFQGYHP